MKKLKIILILVVMTVFCSCEKILEYPEKGKGVDPTLVNVEMQLNINASVQILSQYTTSAKAKATASGTVRYVVDLYDANTGYSIGDTPTQRAIVHKDNLIEGADNTIKVSFKLNAKRYKVLIWVDFTNEGSENIYYTTSDLQFINVKHPYQGSTDQKDGFCGSSNIDLTSYRNKWNVKIDVPVELERPFAKIEVIATDLKLYYDKLRAQGIASSSNLSVRFAYAGFFPSGYNVFSNNPNDAKPGIWFNSDFTPISDNEILVAYDYVFVNGAESAVTADMIIYDNGEKINTVEGLSIPVKRGKLTTIRGDFLTRDYRPGIHIDTEYDGEYTVTIPD